MKLINTPVEEKYLSAGGFMTRCLIAGPEQAEVVLLVHDAAFGGAADVSWGTIIPALAQTYRVIAPDMLGFGGSDKAVFVDRSPYDFRIAHLTALLDCLEINAPIHLIGSSFGGSLGLHMLRTDAHRLASVVSVAGAGGGWRTDYGRSILGAWDGTREGLRSITETLATASAEFDLEAHLDLRLHWAAMHGHYRAVMAAGIRLPEALARSGQRDLFPKLPESEVPVLLIAGTRDKLVDQDWPEKIRPFLPRRTSVQLMDAKHSPNLETPSAFLKVVTAWMSSNGTL